MTPSSDFYEDYQWCPKCRQDVHYLQGLSHSFCIHCGGAVRFFRDRKAAHEFQRARGMEADVSRIRSRTRRLPR